MLDIGEFIEKYRIYIDSEELNKVYEHISELSEYKRGTLTYALMQIGLHPESILKNRIPSHFLSYSDVEEFCIPDRITQIGSNVFRGCRSLKKIIIPQTCKKFYVGCFEDCTSLETVIFEGSLANWCKINFSYPSANPMRDNTGTTKVFINSNLIENELRLPKTVDEVTRYAFYNFHNINYLYIPLNINSIGEYSFYNCKNLSYIELENNKIRLNNGCFSGLGKEVYIKFKGTKDNWKAIYNPKQFENTYMTIECLDGSITKKR